MTNIYIKNTHNSSVLSDNVAQLDVTQPHEYINIPIINTVCLWECVARCNYN